MSWLPSQESLPKDVKNTPRKGTGGHVVGARRIQKDPLFEEYFGPRQFNIEAVSKVWKAKLVVTHGRLKYCFRPVFWGE